MKMKNKTQIKQREQGDIYFPSNSKLYPSYSLERRINDTSLLHRMVYGREVAAPLKKEGMKRRSFSKLGRSGDLRPTTTFEASPAEEGSTDMFVYLHRVFRRRKFIRWPIGVVPIM